MKISFFARLSCVAGVAIRGTTDQFGCTAGDDSLACIRPDLVPVPDRLNPATITSTVNDAGFVVAQNINGDDGTMGDPGATPEPTENPAFRFTIPKVVLADPPPPIPLIICDRPETCTTSTTTPRPNN